MPKYDVITLNLAESLNSYICKSRTIPIIEILEETRTCLIERMFKKYEMIGKCDDSIYPRIRKKVVKEKNKN